MDTLTFIVEMTKALAWPAVVSALLFILRKPLTGLIPLIRKLKYGGLEAEFGQRLNEIDKLRAQISSEPTGETAIGGKEQPKLSRSSDVINSRTMAMQTALGSPRAAVIEAWLRLEIAAKNAAKRLNLNISQDQPVVLIVRALSGANAISPSQALVFHELRVLRNDVVHTLHSDITLSSDDAIRYFEAAENLVETLDAIQPHAK